MADVGLRRESRSFASLLRKKREKVLTQNRRDRAAEARQDVLAEQLVGLVQDVLRSISR